MDLNNDFQSSDEGSDYSLDFDSESGSDSDPFYSGYSERRRRRNCNTYISLPDLKAQYNEDMPMEKKILLFLNAIHEKDFAFAETLLSHDVFVDCVGKDGWTALMKACLNGEKQSVEFLLGKGSNPNFQADLFTPLLACCTNNTIPEEDKLACVELLLQHDCDVNMNDKHKTTPLMLAAGGGYLTIIERLFRVPDLLPNKRDFDGWNAVSHAIFANRIQTVELLLKHGLDYKKRDHYGRTPMMLADEKRCGKILKVLKKLEENEYTTEEEKEDEKDMLEGNPYAHFLKELPNADGEGGFPTDTKDILLANGVKFRKKVPFPVFLNMNEMDLIKQGVKIRAKRSFLLLKVIHRYHRCPWAKTSMVPISKDSMGLEEGVCIIACMAKHLTLIRATLQYVRTRIERRRRKSPTDLQTELVKSLVSIYTSSEFMNNKLKSILELQKRVQTIVRDDTIKKPKEESSKVRTTFKYGLMIMGVTTAGYFIYSNRLKIDGFIKGLIVILD